MWSSTSFPWRKSKSKSRHWQKQTKHFLFPCFLFFPNPTSPARVIFSPFTPTTTLCLQCPKSGPQSFHCLCMYQNDHLIASFVSHRRSLYQFHYLFPFLEKYQRTEKTSSCEGFRVPKLRCMCDYLLCQCYLVYRTPTVLVPSLLLLHHASFRS